MKSEWIRCSEKMPTESGYYLVCLDRSMMVLGYSHKSKCWNANEYFELYPISVVDQVRSWMPLPPAPEDENGR